jgi:alginate O-acetyltransferase complex protein AlgI
MLLGGLWHGAAWTFVAWGALHGIYLIVNYAWQSFCKTFAYSIKSKWLKIYFARILTFVSVTVAWVFFRAETFKGAVNILKSMIGINGFALPIKYLSKFSLFAPKLEQWGVPFRDLIYFKGSNETVFLFLLLLIVWFVPNTHQIMGEYSPAIDTYRGEIRPFRYKWLKWQPAYHWAVTLIAIMVVSILSLSKASEFLYFQF